MLTCQVTFSMLEIYNEQVQDLLSSHVKVSPPPLLHTALFSNPPSDHSVPNPTVREVSERVLRARAA